MENQIEKLFGSTALEQKHPAVGILKETEICSLLELENCYLREIGEAELDGRKYEQLSHAIRSGRITFFAAKYAEGVVGMCSVSRCFSTFSCADTGVFEDFYIKPAFRGKGIARMLAEAAQAWCTENGVKSLTVCCAACDEAMYKALGFQVRLGSTYAN